MFSCKLQDFSVKEVTSEQRIWDVLVKIDAEQNRGILGQGRHCQ